MKEGRIWIPPRSRRFTIAIVLMGILFTSFGSFLLYSNLSFYSGCLKTEGVVTSKDIGDEGGYYLKVQFVNEKTGKQVTVGTDYDFRYGEIGNKVEVLYDPDNPTTNVRIGLHWSDDLPGPIFSIGAFLFLGVVLLICAFYSARGYYQSPFFSRY